MDDQQIDHFASLLENLKPEEECPLKSLPNSNDNAFKEENEDADLTERGTMVHGFNSY